MDEHEAPIAGDWDPIAEWWTEEITGDPIYASDVHPLYRMLTRGLVGRIADLGCGDGQAMAMTGSGTIGIDLSQALLEKAISTGPCVRSRLPDLSCFRDDAFDHACSVYLLDLIDDEERFFAETARTVRAGGSLSVVMNHPVYTAPDSAPIADLDGEVLWRWGHYRSRGASAEPAGEHSVVFFHRPVDVLLNAAAAEGWMLERLVEQPLSPAAIAAVPGYDGQDSIPRLLGARWANIGRTSSRIPS
jgi:SAM-dependent methyltransferase